MKLLARCDTCQRSAPLDELERDRDDVLCCPECAQRTPSVPEFVVRVIRRVIAEDRRERAA